MRRKSIDLRQNRALPDGYRTRQIDGLWYLFDDRNVMVAGPGDRATVEERAWRDVWRQIDSEIDDDITALREGSRSVHELHRLPQYLRMWDDVAKVRAESAEHRSAPVPVVRRLIGTAALTAAALAAAAALVVVATSIAQGPGGLAFFRQPKPLAEQAAGVLPKVAALSLSPPAVEAVPAVAPAPSVVRTAQSAPVATYAVRVGNFASAASAEHMMHLVRQKGYIVNVVSRGTESQVVTHPYRTRTQATYVVHGLEEIGLSAELIAWRMP
ncbi:MAG TPA: SPOR domain-containing protein [bacterium]|nr:SPOR domain-containing protein [bacterium]